MSTPLRDFVRRLLTDAFEKSRHEISLGIQDAVVPLIVDAVNALLWIASVILLVVFVRQLFRGR